MRLVGTSAFKAVEELLAQFLVGSIPIRSRSRTHSGRTPARANPAGSKIWQAITEWPNPYPRI